MKRIFVSLMIAIAVFFGVLVTVNYAAPGDESDPVITKSYLDNVFTEKIKELVSVDQGSKFELVNMTEGKQIVCGAGTELILRKGSGIVIATEKGGIANVSKSVDLPSGSQVPANSLLIVPFDDGRGFVATADVIVMVKGSYEVIDYSSN
ncbi:MAG: hypothetical protein IJM94_03895 [Clostridia bacterium]|nr:hypothetical protein [Clostridia bacterium]MBQ9997622.1 hypothetical protein [Clostridia bacterium]